MKLDENMTLTLWLTREVARLHGLCAAFRAVVEELRVVDSRLDAIDAAQIQIDAWQEFYELLEKMNPRVAAMIDNRPPRAFDKNADPDSKFPD